jgi:hypothetical protein
MVIDQTTNPKTCAPAERDVSGDRLPALVRATSFTFRSSGARKNLLAVKRSINIPSVRDAGK